ncbi:TusA-related sulfurtransferase [Streptomyces sp. BpilaLS-43]|nr:TusA-related sulfurtransferase [Streptomyces sp. BpilaLS-43]
MSTAPVPAITVDGTGMLCVTLLLKLRKEIDGAEPGTVVHVIATDPAAPLDLPAWCHMTGHHYLGAVPDPSGRSVYALRLGRRRPRHQARSSLAHHRPLKHSASSLADAPATPSPHPCPIRAQQSGRQRSGTASRDHGNTSLLSGKCRSGPFQRSKHR